MDVRAAISLTGDEDFMIRARGRAKGASEPKALAGEHRFAGEAEAGPAARPELPRFALDFPAAIDLADLDGSNGFRIDGIDEFDQSGASVSDAGDVNGDGFGDIVIGAYLADPGGDSAAGESYVVFGKAGGFAASFDLASIDGGNGFRIGGIEVHDQSGRSVSAAGDVNGDGFDDIVIGAYRADPGGDESAGESYVVFGHAGGFDASLDLASLDGSNGFRLDGGFLDRSGFSVSSAADINGDGFDDIVIGAPTASHGGYGNQGESFVVFGRAPTEAVARIGAAGDQTIRGGDLNDTLSGLAGADTLIGDLGNDRIKGGKGLDRLKGGGGKDRFTLDSDKAKDADTILDFVEGKDTIALSAAVYGLPEGALAPGRFVLGNQAQDANDRLIYKSNGKLYFDPDGTGAQAQILIVTLANNAALAASDFVVI